MVARVDVEEHARARRQREREVVDVGRNRRVGERNRVEDAVQGPRRRADRDRHGGGRGVVRLELQRVEGEVRPEHRRVERRAQQLAPLQPLGLRRRTRHHPPPRPARAREPIVATHATDPHTRRARHNTLRRHTFRTRTNDRSPERAGPLRHATTTRPAITAKPSPIFCPRCVWSCAMGGGVPKRYSDLPCYIIIVNHLAAQ